MKIGASMLVGYLRHVYDHAYDHELNGLGRPISRVKRAAEEAAIAAARKVCTGMIDSVIVAVACGKASIVGYHPLGMTAVMDDVRYNPALHDGGPIRLIEDPS